MKSYYGITDVAEASLCTKADASSRSTFMSILLLSNWWVMLRYLFICVLLSWWNH